VIGCATLGPIGRARFAPGTWGSVAGLLYQMVFFHQLGVLPSLLLGIIGVWIAIGICGEAEFRIGRRDPSEVILDEFVAMPFCFLGWEPWMMVGPWPPALVFFAGFALFRLFDITKPLFINKLQDLPGGWGVVMDDVAAALVSCAVLHGAAALWSHFHP
jgi:phosphatidylglycerophosphatase A